GPDGRAPDGGGFAGVGRLLSDVVPAAFTRASGAGTIADRDTVTLSITATVTVAVAEPDVFDDHGTGAHASPAVAGSFGGEPQAGDVHFGAGQRHAAEAVGEEPRDGVDFVLDPVVEKHFHAFGLVVELGELAEAEAGDDAVGAVAEGFDGGAFVFVVLVGDFADDFLEDVLDGDEPGDAAVFVDEDGDVVAVALHPVEQVVE